MNPSSTYFNKPIDISFNGISGRISVGLTESGDIDVDIIDGVITAENKKTIDDIKNQSFRPTDISGQTPSGDRVNISDAIFTFSYTIDQENSLSINSIPRVQSVEIGSGDFVSYEGDKVAVQFDVCGLKNYVPSVDRPVQLITRDNWEITAAPVNGIGDRLEFIKSHNILVRTAKVTVKLDIPGCLSHQVETAHRKLRRVLSLAGFVQGVCPHCTRGTVTMIDGEEPDTVDSGLNYMRLYNTQGSVGSAHRHPLVWGRDFTEYIDETYEKYKEVEEHLPIRQALGYYWDALDSTRPIEGRFLSVCSAIELLAKRYSDLNETKSETKEKIEQIVKKEGVKTDDLSKHAGTSDKASSSIYFYSYSRQYVVHGDNNPQQGKLVADFHAALSLLQRLIGSLLDSTELLSNLDPNSALE